MSNAYVTLLTNESYLPGVLLLAHTLKHEHHTTSKVVILVNSPSLSEELLALVNDAYDEVIDIADAAVSAPLNKVVEQLGRPELAVTFSKLLLWKHLEKYDLVIYLDADTLLLKPLDLLFETHANIEPNQIVASPDAGWPDVFNSGVFVAKPSTKVFDELLESLKDSSKTFDGADQGLLNEHFNIALKGSNWLRLPFLFNVTTNLGQHYEYLPAFTKFFDQISVLHYIGANKPWHSKNGILGSDTANYHHLWWAAFNKLFLPETKLKILGISKQQGGEAENLVFSKYVNAWDEPEQVDGTPVSEPVDVRAPPGVFPWEKRSDAPTATRVFNYSTEDTTDHQQRAALTKLILKLKGLKVDLRPKHTKYNFGEAQGFNPDKLLDEVSKLPLKFLSKQKTKE